MNALSLGNSAELIILKTSSSVIKSSGDGRSNFILSTVVFNHLTHSVYSSVSNNHL